MIFRKQALFAALAISLLCVGFGAAAAQAPPASAPTAATPDNAAAFIGNWSLSADSGNGPLAFDLTIKVDSGKVVADLTSQMQPDGQHITEVLMNGAALELHYNFDYQGSPVPVVLTLTPHGDNVDVNLDFASGAYDMSGTGTKKKS